MVCFLIWQHWSGLSKLLDTGLKAAQPFLIGAGIAYIVNIVMMGYQGLWEKLFPSQLDKLKKPVTLLLSYLSFFAFVFVVFSIVLPDLIASLKQLLTIDFGQIQSNLAQLQEQEWVHKVLELTGRDMDITQQLTSYSRQILNQILGILTGVLNSTTAVASTLFSLFVSLIFSIYVLSSKDNLVRQFQLLIETFFSPISRPIHYVLGVLNSRFHGFFVSQSMEAMILAVLCMSGMFLLKFPYATTVGIFVGFTNFIPVIGAYLGGAIGTILVLTQSPTQAIAFLIYLLILQQFESNVIYPRVVGGSIGLPGVWVLMSVTIGGSLFGVLGMLLAVPTAASLYQIIKDYTYYRQALQEKSSS